MLHLNELYESTTTPRDLNFQSNNMPYYFNGSDQAGFNSSALFFKAIKLH